MSHPPSWGIWAGHCWKPSAPLRRGFLLNGRIWICEWPGPASTGGRYEHKPMQRLCHTQVDRQVADLTCCTCCTLQQRDTPRVGKVKARICWKIEAGMACLVG